MTKAETAQIIFVLKEFYPASRDNSDPANRVTAWHLLLKDYDYKGIEAAVLAFASTDTKGFMPSVGQIIDKYHQMVQPARMSELEAWGYVAKAIRNSSYNAEEEFAKLPTEVQKTVREPQQLREWAVMDADEVQTVVASNFQRSFRTVAQQQRELNALPEKVRLFLGDVTKGLLPGG